MKKLMILGAGIYQVPLIKKAKEMNLSVIVVSVDGNYPGFTFADKVYYEDTTNIEEVLKIARDEKIDGICTTGTDVALPTIGKVVDELGLKGADFTSANLSSNKLLMKEKFMDFGVKTARFIMAKTLDEANDIYQKLDKPVIFKAVDSSGSRGIVRVDHTSQIKDAYQEVKTVTKLDYFIIEEFIEGTEFGAQAFVYNNKLQFVLPHGDTMYHGNGKSVPIGHFAPYDISTSLIKEIEKQLLLSVEALNLNNCAINADFILKGDEVYVLEIGARAGATCLPELVSIYYGFDFYEQMISCALGEEPSFLISNFVPCYSELLVSEQTGTIKGIKIPKTDNEDIFDLSVDYAIGDHIRKFQVGPDRIGQIIARGKTVKEAKKKVDKLKDEIKIIVE